MWKLTRRQYKQGKKGCSSKEKIHLKLSAKEMFKYLGPLFSKTDALQFLQLLQLLHLPSRLNAPPSSVITPGEFREKKPNYLSWCVQRRYFFS